MNSSEDFMAMVAWLPEMLNELKASEIHNLDNRPPADCVGIYLFSEKDRDLYVGRTGITERSRAGRTKQSTSFRGRFDNHTRSSSPPGTAPFANRLLGEELARQEIEKPPNSWWKKRDDGFEHVKVLFDDMKLRIGRMDCRIVAFDDDASGVRSTVAETYIHACLQTPYNNFLTS